MNVVIFYKDENGKDEILEYIESVRIKSLTSKTHRIEYNKILQYFDILRAYGTRAGEPYMKYLGNDLWELRPLDNRILFTHYKNNRYIILSHFKKQTQKTPSRELEKAISRLNKINKLI